MNPPLSIVQLKQLKGIMQSMLAEANDANWQELSRLDSERRVLIGYTERTRTTHDTRLDEASKDGKASPPGSQTEPGSRIKPESQARPFPASPVSTTVSPVRTASNEEYVALSLRLLHLTMKSIQQYSMQGTPCSNKLVFCELRSVPRRDTNKPTPSRSPATATRLGHYQ